LIAATELQHARLLRRNRTEAANVSQLGSIHRYYGSSALNGEELWKAANGQCF
jgi:hypothetical protein